MDERKQKILRMIVEDYVHGAEPVGSRHISRKLHSSVSPATIRNEMSDLEEEGYIAQPHTSAGRVPTDKGYRYYVDNLMRVGDLPQRDESLITKAHREARFGFERAVHNLLTTTATLSHYAAIMMTESSSGRHRIFYHGITNIASQPEFSDSNHLKHLLGVFEEQDLLRSILKDCSSISGTTITIGSENKFKEIKDCSLIVGPRESESDETATVGLIGPTRMFYDRAYSIIERVSRQLIDILEAEGHEG